MEKKNGKYAIVGGGLVGSLLSLMLTRKGWEVDVYERRPDPRVGGAVGGRSINLALSTRGLRALEGVGLTDEVRSLCIPMRGRIVHDPQGRTNFQAYGKGDQSINSISRGGLNELLLQATDAFDNSTIFFEHRLEAADLQKGALTFDVRGQSHTSTYDAIFGTDGAFSSLRGAMMRTERFSFSYSQQYLEHGYKELTIPAREGGGWRLDREALHIWPRKSFMLIALPNLDGSFTCTLFLAMEGDTSFDKLKSQEDVQLFFESQFPDVLEHMPTLHNDFEANPTSSLVTIYTDPWYYKDKATLLGDASHAIVPFYGQGMNAGFEDAYVLDNIIKQHGGESWEHIFSLFNKERKPNADAIAELALRNFVEMRDLVADPHFLKKNKLSKRLSELLPEEWQTLYSMVSFSNIPYLEALERGDAQNAILEELVREENGREFQDHELVQKIKEKLK